jgi:hypothetical protein
MLICGNFRFDAKLHGFILGTKGSLVVVLKQV